MSLRGVFVAGALGFALAAWQAPAPPAGPAESPKPQASAPAAALRIALERKDDRVVVTAGGERFTEYRWTGDTKPFLYPVLAPTGAHATRRWPEEDVPGE